MRESAEQILAACQARGLKLRRRGQEWNGPCPSCGGEDRFFVNAAGMIGCRRCNDFRSITAALGLNGRPADIADQGAVDRVLVKTERRQAKAAQRAAEIYARCRPRRHQYLAAKGFRELKLPVHENRIVVPVWGSNGLQSLQFIGRSRKRFLSGGKMASGSVVLGPCDPRGRWWHVEGLATGLSVRRALRSIGVPDCVVVCFSAGGLMVAKDCRRALVVADHDWWSCPNKHRWDHPAAVCPECGDKQVTEPAGEKAALGIAAPWWQPPAPGTDANDYEQAHGTGALAAAIRPLMMGRPSE